MGAETTKSFFPSSEIWKPTFAYKAMIALGFLWNRLLPLFAVGNQKCWFQMIILCGDVSGVFSFGQEDTSFWYLNELMGKGGFQQAYFPEALWKGQSVGFFFLSLSTICHCFKMGEFNILG